MNKKSAVVLILFFLIYPEKVFSGRCLQCRAMKRHFSKLCADLGWSPDSSIPLINFLEQYPNAIKECDLLRLKTVTLESQIVALKSEIADLNNQCSQLKYQHQQGCMENAELAERLKTLDQAHQYPAQVLSLTQESKKLREQRDGSWKVIEELKAELKTETQKLEAQIAILEKQASSQMESLFAQLSVSREGGDLDIQSALRKVIDERNTFEKEIAALKENIGSLQSSKLDAEKLRGQLKTEADDFKLREAAWLSEKAGLMQKVKTLEEHLEEMMS